MLYMVYVNGKASDIPEHIEKRIELEISYAFYNNIMGNMVCQGNYQPYKNSSIKGKKYIYPKIRRKRDKSYEELKQCNLIPEHLSKFRKFCL